MKHQAGFTLIELMVVFAVVFLVLVFILPLGCSKDDDENERSGRSGFGFSSSRSEQTRCMANLRQLAIAYTMYSLDNDDKVPVGWVTEDLYHQWKPAQQEKKGGIYSSWCNPPVREDGTYAGSHSSSPEVTLEDRERGIRTGALYPYTQSENIYHCPGDERIYEGTRGGSGPSYQAYRSYSLPDGLAGFTTQPLPVQSVHASDIIRKISSVQYPQDKYSFVEERNHLKQANYNWQGWSFVPEVGLYTWWDPVSFHRGGCNIAFIDGHIENYEWKDDRSAEYMRNPEKANQAQQSNSDIDWFVSHYPINKPYQSDQGPK